MFMADRDVKCERLRRRRAGHEVFVHRHTTSSSSRRSTVPHDGHVVGIVQGVLVRYSRSSIQHGMAGVPKLQGSVDKLLGFRVVGQGRIAVHGHDGVRVGAASVCVKLPHFFGRM